MFYCNCKTCNNDRQLVGCEQGTERSCDPYCSTADYQQHLCFSTRGNRQRMQALLYQRRDKRSFPLSNYIRQTLRLPNSPSSTPENWGRIIYSYSTPNSDFLILFSFPNCELCWLEQRWRRFGYLRNNWQNHGVFEDVQSWFSWLVSSISSMTT